MQEYYYRVVTKINGKTWVLCDYSEGDKELLVLAIDGTCEKEAYLESPEQAHEYAGKVDLGSYKIEKVKL